MGILKNILFGVCATVVTAGAGFVGGAVYKDKTMDVTQTEEYIQVVDENTELQCKLDDKQSELSTVLTDKLALELQITSLNNNLKLLQSDIANKQELINELQINAENNVSQINALQNELNTQIEEFNALNEEYVTMQSIIDDKMAKIAELNSQISNLQTQLENATNQIDVFNTTFSNNTIISLNNKTQNYENIELGNIWFTSGMLYGIMVTFTDSELGGCFGDNGTGIGGFNLTAEDGMFIESINNATDLSAITNKSYRLDWADENNKITIYCDKNIILCYECADFALVAQLKE